MALQRWAAALALVAGGAAAQGGPDLGEGFLCCNLRSDGRWISDSNYRESGKTILPLGTPVRHKGYARYQVLVEIDGQPQTIGNDYSRDLAMDVFARRYLVKEDPRPKVAAAPEKIRRAIESARATPGMTREQVIMALSYPMSSENPHLDAPVWHYWLWSFQPFDVHFGPDGTVTRVTGHRDALPVVWLP